MNGIEQITQSILLITTTYCHLLDARLFCIDPRPSSVLDASYGVLWPLHLPFPPLRMPVLRPWPAVIVPPRSCHHLVIVHTPSLHHLVKQIWMLFYVFSS